jgi:hypothetical protein
METETIATPELYVYTNITRTTKGYSHETTTTVRGDLAPGARLADLLAGADHVARTEIERRESRDLG